MSIVANISGQVKRLKILLIVFNEVGVGTYWRAYHFGRTLARRGHHVTLMATSKTSHFKIQQTEIDGIHLVSTPDWLAGSLRSGWDIWNIVRRIVWVWGKEYDLVHGFETRPVVLFPALIATLQGTKLVLDWADWFGRGGLVEQRSGRFVRTILRYVETFFEERFRHLAQGTTVINHLLLNRAITLGVRSESIALIRNGSDIAHLPISRNEARQLLRLPLDMKLIGFLGRASLQDTSLMAHAFNLVESQLPSSSLLLIGNFNRLIEPQISNPEAIIRTGSIDARQIHLYLSACDICWLPLCDTGANQGRWPLKINDYMTAGRAIIATNVGEVGDMIRNYGCGVTTAVDAELFATETVCLFRDERLLAKLGQEARQAANDVFSWEKMGNELEQFYEWVVAQK